jgi:hypothetical protein
MQWFLHGSMTPAVQEALVRHGDKAHPIADLGETVPQTVSELLAEISKRQWDLITNDPALVHAIYDEKIFFPRTVVFLQLSGGDVEQDDAIDRLFDRYPRMTLKRLYTVTETRVKVRQLPG